MTVNTELFNFAESIAAHLEGRWDVRESSVPWNVNIVRNDGARITLNWHGPSRVSFEGGAVSPLHMYVCFPETPKGTASTDRPAEDIARDITRKVIPALDAALPAAIARRAEQTSADRDAHAFCETLEATLGDNVEDRSRGLGRAHASFSTHSHIAHGPMSSVNISDLSADQALSLAAWMVENGVSASLPIGYRAER